MTGQSDIYMYVCLLKTYTILLNDHEGQSQLPVTYQTESKVPLANGFISWWEILHGRYGIIGGYCQFRHLNVEWEYKIIIEY